MGCNVRNEKKRGMKAKGVANSLDKSPDEVEIR